MRTLLLCALVLFALSPPRADACGYTPWSAESESRDAAARNLLEAERLPLLSPGWNSEYWLIAWARLQGKVFSESEIASLMGTDWLRPSTRVDEALEVWGEARALVSTVSHRVEPRREADHYRYELVCGPDAFVTAAATLRQQIAARTTAETTRWLEAQDRVFAACSDVEAPAPASPAPGASERERFDRAYQHAVWAEYTGSSAAQTEYEAVAGTTSPWAEIAGYRAARIMLRAGTIRPDELRRAMARAQDPKVRRGFRQLLDRAELFGEPPREIVRVLAERLVQTDLGADLPRTLRDIVWFAKRDPNPCGDEVSGLVACRGTAESADLSRPPTLMRLRHAAPDEGAIRMAEQAPLLELNALFHRGRRAAESGQRATLRRIARRARQLARTSTAATRNAMDVLALAAASGAETARFLAREGAPQEGTPQQELHGDGRRVLAASTMDELDRAARAHPALADWIAQHAFVRAYLLNSLGRARRYARIIARGDGEFALALRAALQGRPATHRFAFALAIAEHDPVAFSVQHEFQTSYGTNQDQGCFYGECGDAHPNQTAASRLVADPEPSPERVRLGVRRLDTFGDRVLALVRAQPRNERAPELLHHFVQRTRRASVGRATSERTGSLSHAAFLYLHRHHAGDPWTERTGHWYR